MENNFTNFHWINTHSSIPAFLLAALMNSVINSHSSPSILAPSISSLSRSVPLLAMGFNQNKQILAEQMTFQGHEVLILKNLNSLFKMSKTSVTWL